MKIFQSLICILLCAFSSVLAQQGDFLYPQQPLKAQKADIALLFFGGFGDELTGIMHHLCQTCPALAPSVQEQRAYYHWHGDSPESEWPHLASCLKDVAAFQELNPQVPIVLIGHSMGAVAAFEVANRMEKGISSIYLITLDPVDRKSARQRSAQVNWWGHIYVERSPSKRDFIYAAAGRWGSMPAADQNISAQGEQFIHDWAASLLMKAADGHELLLNYLRKALGYPVNIR